jgi:hypothetical protein
MRCNFCLLAHLHALAATTQRTVTIAPAPRPDYPDGIAIFVHPPGCEDVKDWWAAWLPQAPTRCTCGGTKIH